jgi:hypothetical protein
MAIATYTDPSADEWRIGDGVVRLRRWGTDEVYPLPGGDGAWDIGAADGVWLRLEDETNRVSRLHARLSFDGARWGITDLESKNGIRCDGARRLAFALAPGVEVGIGGITLLAESPGLIALRGVLARLIGWSPARAGDVDLALREVRLAATRRESLVLCGDGDLVSVARLLHRHALGDARPFVVCDPRRRATDSSARAAANYSTGLEALAAALGGTLCVWRNRQPPDFDAVIAYVRAPTSRVQLVVCTHALQHAEPLIASPIVLPPLAARAAELDRVIDEYAADAVAALGAGATFTPADRDWVRRHEAATLARIEKATRRLAAIRGNGGSITRAAAQLAMSHAALSEWVARRTLPE